MTTARDSATQALRPYIEQMAERMPPEVAINIGEMVDAVLTAIDDRAVLKLPRYYVRDEGEATYLIATEENGSAVAFSLDTSNTIDLVQINILMRASGSNSGYERVDAFAVNHDNLRNFALAALAAIEDQHARNTR
jgi:hypothetical protein